MVAFTLVSMPGEDCIVAGVQKPKPQLVRADRVRQK